MSSKNNKPYSTNNKNNRNRRSSRNYNNYSGSKKRKPQKVKLENTMRIRIDDERLNDFESLDTSFLEGRLDKKVKNNKTAKEKLLREKEKKSFNFRLIRNIFFFLMLICIVIAVIIAFRNYKQNHKNEKVEEKEKVVEKVKVDLDDNYVFVGDSHTKNLDFEDLDYHYVKVSENDLKVTDVLDDLNEKIYKYNPTIVFIELGMVDLRDGREQEDIVDDLEKIVDKIKKNRPYAKIYVEAIYPINKEHEDYDDDLDEEFDNEAIKEINKLILKMAKENKVEYLDMFDLLEKDGKLDEDYTNNGLKLNDEGNNKVMEKIEKIVG